MKYFILITFSFFSLQATALEKCVINGKVTYKQGLCSNQGDPQDTKDLNRQAKHNAVINQRQQEQAVMDAQIREKSPKQEGLFSKEELEMLKRQAMDVCDASQDSVGSCVSKNNRAKNARKLLELSNENRARAKTEYEITVSKNDEFFIIHDQKFKAKTSCFNMNVGDKVIFIDGSNFGACVSAEVVNLRTGDKCKLWCE